MNPPRWSPPLWSRDREAPPDRWGVELRPDATGLRADVTRDGRRVGNLTTTDVHGAVADADHARLCIRAVALLVADRRGRQMLALADQTAEAIRRLVREGAAGAVECRRETDAVVVHADGRRVGSVAIPTRIELDANGSAGAEIRETDREWAGAALAAVETLMSSATGRTIVRHAAHIGRLVAEEDRIAREPLVPTGPDYAAVRHAGLRRSGPDRRRMMADMRRLTETTRATDLAREWSST